MGATGTFGDTQHPPNQYQTVALYNPATGTATAGAVLASKSETVAVSTASVGLTAANYAGASSAVVQVQDDEIRFWVDGTAPTSLTGMKASAGDSIELNSPAEIVAFHAIRSSTSSVTAHMAVTYFG